MMRSVSSSSPRSGSPRPVTAVIGAIVGVCAVKAVGSKDPTPRTRSDPTPRTTWARALRVRFLEHLPGVGHFSGDGGRGHHHWTHEQRAAGRTALAPLEIAVRR